MSGSGASSRIVFALLLTAAIFATPARGALWRSTELLSCNAMGDTIWFDSPLMPVGSHGVAVTPGGLKDMPTLRMSCAQGRSLGTPLAILMPEREPSPPADSIVQRALRHRALGFQYDDLPDDWGITTRESGVGNYDGRRLFGWDLDFPPEDERTFRFVFVVIGLAEAQIDTLHRPASIRNTHYLRPFEIPIADRLKTARIVGEYRADLKHGRVERVSLH